MQYVIFFKREIAECYCSFVSQTTNQTGNHRQLHYIRRDKINVGGVQTLANDETQSLVTKQHKYHVMYTKPRTNLT